MLRAAALTNREPPPKCKRLSTKPGRHTGSRRLESEDGERVMEKDKRRGDCVWYGALTAAALFAFAFGASKIVSPLGEPERPPCFSDDRVAYKCLENGGCWLKYEGPNEAFVVRCDLQW